MSTMEIPMSEQLATARNTELARDMLRHAHMVTTDLPEQIAALVTAATVQIERDVGAPLAAGALWALVEPTLTEWRKAEGALTEQDHADHVGELVGMILGAARSGQINPDHLFLACLTAAQSLLDVQIGAEGRFTPVSLALAATVLAWRNGRA